MWHLVCSRGVQVTYRDIRADEQKGTAHWEAQYTFQKTGRPVHNLIDSIFRFRDGKILEHIDQSSRWHWAWQALGFPKCPLVTLFPFLLRKQASEQLKEFGDKHSNGR